MALALVSACSPTLDWREVRPEGSAAVALFPCKPQVHERRVPLAGQILPLNLVACSAGDQTWGLAHVDVADPARVGPALAELQRLAALNVGSTQALTAPLAIAGATPQPGAARVRLSGQRSDGSAVQMEVAVFAHGTRVFQVTALGRSLSTEAVDTFMGALRIAP